MLKKNGTFILLLLYLWLPGSLLGQAAKGMFMNQVAGNNFIKKNFDKNGDLKGFQIFKVGEIGQENNVLIMPMTILKYDKNGVINDSSSTRYTCNPSAKMTLMNALPFAGGKQDVELELESQKEFYPIHWERLKQGDLLPDISFNLLVKGGIIGAMGTTSKTLIFDRRITGINPDLNQYSISSKMTIKAYAIGINFNTKEYVIEEKIHPQQGIIGQVYRESSGEYFTITQQ